MANEVLKNEFKNFLKYNELNEINDNFNFYFEIIKLYVNNKFISLSLKKKLKDINDIIIQKLNKTRYPVQPQF